MHAPREIRCSRYVDRSYSQVRERLTREPTRIFARDVDVTLEPTTRPPAAPALPAMAMAIVWHAKMTAPFESLRAQLTVYPLSDEETELELHGWYTPPLGVLGSAADALVGHRLVEATVHRLLDEVCDRLRSDAPGDEAAVAQ